MIISDEHFAYLQLQKGSLHGLSHDRAAWEAAYQETIREDFLIVSAFMPIECNSILDIGGGLGGVDVLLRNQVGPDCEVCILDGENDPPVVVKHRETFNSRAVTLDFLNTNGVRKASYRSPDDMGLPAPYDLIMSLGSWCFHYEPDQYLFFVERCFRKNTVLIVDVRSGKDSWMSQLKDTFDIVGMAKSSAKFSRMVFCAKA